jgi:hypothetical protein
MIDGLTKLMYDPKTAWDTVLINMSTLIRNRVDPEVKAKDSVNIVYTEIEEMIRDIAQMYENAGRKGAVLFYFLDHHRSVPLFAVRTLSAGRKDVLDRSVQLNQLIVRKTPKSNAVPVFFHINPHKLRSVWKELANQVATTRTTGNVIHISHQPLDYHVAKSVRNYRLLDSYTQIARTYKEIGEKLYDSPHMPFNTMIHAILGDKEHITPSITHNNKARFFTLAEEKRWKTKTEAGIKSDIAAGRFTIPFVI